MRNLKYLIVLISLHFVAATQEFTIANGQIYTPGFVVVDAPQPWTPLGGG